MSKSQLTESEKLRIRNLYNITSTKGSLILVEQEKEEMETRDKNIGDKIKDFFSKGPAPIKWPKLPSWIRNHFIKKWNHLPGTKKYKTCTLAKCPAYDALSDDEKKKLGGEALAESEKNRILSMHNNFVDVPGRRLNEQFNPDSIRKMMDTAVGRVKALQQYCKIPVDGKMGTKTLDCLKKIQKEHGLTPDGKIGMDTIKVLKDLIWKDESLNEQETKLGSGPTTPAEKSKMEEIRAKINAAIVKHLSSMEEKKLKELLESLTEQQREALNRILNVKAKEMVQNILGKKGDGPTEPIKEQKKWMQKADKDIEKKGTEGVFHKWCVDHGYKDGCDSKCWTAAKKEGSPWSKRAGLAKAFCESKH